MIIWWQNIIKSSKCVVKNEQIIKSGKIVKSVCQWNQGLAENSYFSRGALYRGKSGFFGLVHWSYGTLYMKQNGKRDI
jgi:hypothetical protein